MKTTHTIKYALFMASALIIYFILIDIIGYAGQSYLSFFNAIIVGAGIYFVIKDVYKNANKFKYMDGFVAGIKAGFIATILYTIFMAIYLFEIHPELCLELKEQVAIAGEGIEAALLLFIFLSGLATSIVLPLVILPLYKKSWNTRDIREKQKPLNQ
ncbi:MULTISPECIES: hypothetical protein [unclassified Nonlabens]|uniref:hypothetical protein n=1 Tax=unclassified Nonlabens TaxID=2615035 RepID=UPI00386627F5